MTREFIYVSYINASGKTIEWMREVDSDLRAKGFEYEGKLWLPTEPSKQYPEITYFPTKLIRL